MNNLPLADIELLARLAKLSIEETIELLREGETVGWPADMLVCMGSLAPRMVEMSREQLIRQRTC
jgi:hypothetical protein